MMNARNATVNHDSPTTAPANPPRLGLVGCGAIAEMLFMPALAEHPEVMQRLTLIDRNPARARMLADRFGVQRCAVDYHECMDSLDGVILALPTPLHHQVAMEFLSRGIDVLCEKPLAESASKAMEMVEESLRTGARLATNYSQRLWPQFAKVKELISGGSLGAPVHIRYYVGEPFQWPTVTGFYFNSPASTRGILRDRGAHVIDHLCWWLGGKPHVLKCENDSFGGSEATTLVQFEYGQCTGEVKLSWLSKFPSKFTVECEHGLIEGDVSYPQSIMVQKGSGPPKRVNLKSEPYSALGKKMVTNFIAVVAHGEKPIVAGSEVLDSVEFIDQCYAVATRFVMPWYESSEYADGC